MISGRLLTRSTVSGRFPTTSTLAIRLTASTPSCLYADLPTLSSSAKS